MAPSCIDKKLYGFRGSATPRVCCPRVCAARLQQAREPAAERRRLPAGLEPRRRDASHAQRVEGLDQGAAQRDGACSEGEVEAAAARASEGAAR